MFALNSWLRGLGAGGAYAFAMALNPSEFVRSLARKSPLIIALKGSGTETDGHAYIITAVDYFVNFFTWEVSISKITVRDPWPESPSEQEFTWAEFAPRFMFAIGINGLN